MDSGRIVETGTHADLIQAGGIYSKLYELSFEPAST
jgi:subfamily B ATP-binding cassette protein MsbA